MSNSDKPAVVRRLRRGRSALDSKHKTDSGCFVDEELERNGSSDSSSGSLNSSPLREETQKVGNPVNDSKKAESVTASLPGKPSIVEDCPRKSKDGYDKATKAMDEEDGNLVNTHVDNNAAATKNSNTLCNAIEKSRYASDFYCLYYSGSPEGTLTRSGKDKLNGKPPVPPKPRLRRGSAPPSSFNNIENVQQQNREVKKRLAYNRCHNNRPKSDTIVNLLNESQDLKSVQQCILYFETFGQSASSESETELIACNDTQDLETPDQLKTAGDEISEQKTLSNILEESVPLVEEEVSLVEFSSPEPLENDTRINVPLVEPEESLVDDSRCLSQHFLENVNKIDETFSFNNALHSNFVDSPVFEFGESTASCARGKRDKNGEFNENSDGKMKGYIQEDEYGVAVVQTSRERPRETPKLISLQLNKCSSVPWLSDIECLTEPNISETTNENSPKVDEATGVELQLNSKGIDILRFPCSSAEVCSNEAVRVSHGLNYQPYLEGKKQTYPKDHWLNSHVDEINEEVVQNSECFASSGSQRHVGSFCGLPHSERDVSSQLKRRSWSVCDAKPKGSYSPFVRKVYQIPVSKLTTTSWRSESGLSSPFVRTLHPYESKQSSLPDVAAISKKNVFQRKIGRRQLERLEPSGYASDDSSVHSEPLFQPLKRKPQSLNCARFARSVSDESVISELSGTESDMPYTSVHRRRLQHSVESRDPLNALQRQSIEFAKEEPAPPFRPISPVQVPHLQALRRSLSYTSSLSDSEVEKIFKQTETPPSLHSARVHHGVHNGILTAGNSHKISAMEALFGPQTPKSSMPGSDCSSSGRKTLSERFSEVQPHQYDFEAEEFESEEFESEECESEESLNVEDGMLKGIDEPGLEFDDTDYSEFYTLCEDKESLITAEAMSIKKLLKSPQTVLADSDIESVVLSATERRVLSPSFSEDHEENESTLASPRIAADLIQSDGPFPEETSSELEDLAMIEKRNRGTQTPPPEVFRALSPPPSVGTQTPPLSLAEGLSPYIMHKTSNPSSVRSLSPPLSQPLVEQLGDVPHHFGVANVSFSEPDLPLSLQGGNKAISVEELLHILANMQVGQPAQMPPPSRRSVSIQRYNSSIPPDAMKGKVPQSLPSSWQYLNQSDSKQDSDLHLKSSSRMQWSSKSHDCIRQSLHKNDNRDVIQAKMVGFRESNENIRKKLKEWKLRTRLFEEEVECMEDKETKDKWGKVNAEVALKVSYDGSESTDSIETQSKLTKTRSLKRPRKDRAFSQKEKEQHNNETSSKTHELSNSIKHQTPKDTQFDLTPNMLLAEIPNSGNERSAVDSPVGINVFIDYRKKNGQHIMCTSTPKPPTEPGSSLFDKEGGVGYPSMVLRDRPVGYGIAEDFQTDAECQGDASSSSYSSDDDPFGEFGGSTETVVFVDTEPSSEISLTPDSTIPDSFELKLVETPSETAVYEKSQDWNDKDSTLDVLLGEARRSLNLEVLDADILDKAIERFKQRVSPKLQNNAPSDSLSMEASAALHQADQLQGIISEIKGELKLLQDENVMLREQVESLANHQTAGEVTENSSTESSERLEHVLRLSSKAQHGGDTDEYSPVEVDVCLRGFSPTPLLHIHSKKRDILLGTVSVKGADWNGVIDAARRTFVEHMARIDSENYLCLGPHSIQGVETGVIVWSPGSLRRNSPRVALSQKSNPCVIQLKDGSHFSCDSLVYDTLLPKEVIEKYVEELLENRCIVLCGHQGLGKSYLAARLGEHIVQRIGWKRSPAVLTFNVAQTTRKELKQELFTMLQCSVTSHSEGTPAVIILDQLNCLASLADIFELSQLQDNKACPYIIGVRDKSRKGPFSSKELTLCQYFRWLRVSIHDRQYVGLLGRFLRRKLSWSEVPMDSEETGPLLELFNWLSKLWYHLNEILEDFCEPDSAIGPSLFFSCPMDFKAAEGWFGVVWNYHVIPFLHQALRVGRKIFSRYISWEDPTKWVVLRYPWNKDQSRVLPTLRKLRQVDIVLNRNQLGSDNVSFAECIEDNERILRAHSTMSKRVRTVVQEKIPKGQLNAKRKAIERENRSDDEDRDSCYSETDSYLETSI